MAIPNLTLSSWDNRTASCVVTGNLFPDLHGKTAFKTGDRAIILQEGSGEICLRHVQDAQTELEEAMSESPTLDTR